MGELIVRVRQSSSLAIMAALAVLRRCFDEPDHADVQLRVCIERPESIQPQAPRTPTPAPHLQLGAPQQPLQLPAPEAKEAGQREDAAVQPPEAAEGAEEDWTSWRRTGQAG